MLGVKPLPEPVDLPLGGHVWDPKRGLVWKRRVDWSEDDYRFFVRHYQMLSQSYAAVSDEAAREAARRYRGWGRG